MHNSNIHMKAKYLRNESNITEIYLYIYRQDYILNIFYNVFHTIFILIKKIRK